MITPEALKQKLLKKYPVFLKEQIRGESSFPYRPRVDLALDYTRQKEALLQLRKLEEQAKPQRGYGYTLEYRTVKTRRFGTQTRPHALIFETPEDFFTFIDKQDEANRFFSCVDQSRSAFSVSDHWLSSHYSLILRYLDVWPDIIQTTGQLMELDTDADLTHLHSRLLPVSLDTKFIERNKSPIQKLLQELQITTFNLDDPIYSGEMLFWLRFYQSSHSFYHARIGIFPVEELQEMVLPVDRVLIIENKACFIQDIPRYIESLASPGGLAHTLLLWGQGNACLGLKNVSWLGDKELYYWGDMDLHGLAILGRFRKHFPGTRSLAMDMAAYEEYADFAVPGLDPGLGSWYDYLTVPEKELADCLRRNPERSRVEQERIG